MTKKQIIYQDTSIEALRILREATKDFDFELRNRFHLRLLGALTVLIPIENWEHAIKTISETIELPVPSSPESGRVAP